MADRVDLDDPLIREMADRNHLPEERWTVTGRLLGVSCRQCFQPWPCATRKALNARESYAYCESCGGQCRDEGPTDEETP